MSQRNPFLAKLLLVVVFIIVIETKLRQAGLSKAIGAYMMSPCTSGDRYGHILFVLWGLGYTLVQYLMFSLFSFEMGIFTLGHCILDGDI